MSVTREKSMAEWAQLLRHPPSEVVGERKRLQERASQLAAALTGVVLPPELDCVVGGSGFMSQYFLGVQSVLLKLEAAGQCVIRRFAGASSGAQTPYQTILRGEDAVLDAYLAYGMRCDTLYRGAGLVRSAINSDRHWRELARCMFEDHGSTEELEKLDGRMFVSVSVLRWNGLRNKLYSHHSRSLQLAKQIFYATGGAPTRCDGRLAVDGGFTNNLPRFTDQLRPMLLVVPSRSGLPLTMAARYSFADAVFAMERGQDDIVRLFREGTLTTPSGKAGQPAISLVDPRS